MPQVALEFNTVNFPDKSLSCLSRGLGNAIHIQSLSLNFGHTPIENEGYWFVAKSQTPQIIKETRS